MSPGLVGLLVTGDFVGSPVGTELGWEVGLLDVGCELGCPDGLAVGWLVGCKEGLEDGNTVG